MMLELFVAGMCIGGYECNKTPQAYYQHNKELQRMVKEAKGKVENMAGPVVVNYLIPYGTAIGMIGAGKTASVSFSKRLSIEGNIKEERFGLVWTWTY